MNAPETSGARATERTAVGVRWAVSPALAGAVVVGLVCVVAGFVLSRVEPALVGAPLLIAAALSWDRRPATDAVEVTTAVAVPSASELSGTPEAALTGVDVSVSASSRSDALHLRLNRAGAPPVDAVVTPRAAAALRIDVPLVHSGPQRLLAVRARPVGGDAGWVGEPGAEAQVERVVSPLRRVVRSLPLPARLLGLTGQHTSSRPGEGGEFRDIDVFRPGDRLRRIDWKATARAGRQGELYVRRTTATSDAAIQLVIDSRDDLGAPVGDWARVHPRPAVSLLDLAREAAASLAAAYARSGDRVGFDDLASRAAWSRRERERVTANAFFAQSS